MQTWAKRGFQTALVTGGLLMLGTGIASADDNVNPDLPPSPLDGSLTVPVKIDNNAIGTPFGQHNLPGTTREVTLSPSDLGKSLPVAGTATPALPAMDQLTPATGAAMGNLPTGMAAAPKTDAHCCGDDALRGNKVVGDLVVPIDISGNAIGLLGNAYVENESQQHAGESSPIMTSGEGHGLAGNVVALQWALPVQITGNAIALLGNAETYNTAEQSAVAGGDIETSGEHGSIAGNVLAGQFATPVQLNGNAVSGGGNATADSATYNEGTSGGTIETTGEDGSLSGNVGAVPIASPVQGNGNAVALVGISDTFSSADSYAQAGDETVNPWGTSQYILTNGDPAAASGNVVQPAVAGPVALDCNAAAGVGNSSAICLSGGDADAGGGNATTGEGSSLSGNVAHAPVALPTRGGGNAAGVIGNALTDSTNSVSSEAGGGSYTHGDDSVLSGTTLVPSVTAPIDACGNTGAGGGQAGAICVNDSDSTSGGDTSTSGNDSVGSGNNGTVPVTLPVEALANTAGAVGGTESVLEEDKNASSGGDNTTNDDAGTAAANLVSVPVAGPVQAIGNGAGAVANTNADTATESDIVAGGDNTASGDGGSAAGNIVQAPVAVPAQVIADGVTAVGHGTTTGTNDVDSTAGGDAETTGEDGSIAGNVVSAPVGSAVQSFGESVAVGGINNAAAESVTGSTAGGDTQTTGEGGAIAGNVVAAQALPIVQSFGAAASGVGGQNTAAALNDTDASSGGDIDTNGDHGQLSGNLLDVPAAAVAQPHGDAVAAIGSESTGASDSTTEGSAGGTSTTSGEHGSLSGIDGTVPVGVDAPIYDVPVEVLAEAMAFGNDTRDITVGEDSPQLELPAAGGLAANKLPSMPRVGALPGAKGRSDVAKDPISDLFGGLLGKGVQGAGFDQFGNLTQGGLGGLTGGLSGRDLNVVPGKTLPAPAAAPAPRFAAPAMPGLDNLKGVFKGNLFQAPKLDRLPVQTPALAGLNAPNVDRLPVQTPALAGLNAPKLPADVDGARSLADTKSQLAGVFGHFPIG